MLASKNLESLLYIALEVNLMEQIDVFTNTGFQQGCASQFNEMIDRMSTDIENGQL